MLSCVTLSKAITVYLRQDKLDFAGYNTSFRILCNRRYKTYNKELQLAIVSSKFASRNNAFYFSMFLQILLTVYLIQNWGIDLLDYKTEE